MVKCPETHEALCPDGDALARLSYSWSQKSPNKAQAMLEELPMIKERTALAGGSSVTSDFRVRLEKSPTDI